MKTIGILFASALLFAGCKKKEEPAAGTASGSSAMGSGMGSAAGSDTGSAMGSGSAMAGSGSDTGSAAGSGAATAGSGSATAGSGDTKAASTEIKDDADYVDKTWAAMEKSMAMYTADGTDCKKLAADMTTATDENKDMMKAMMAYAKAHPSAGKAYMAKMKEKSKEVKEFTAKSQAAEKACAKDKDYAAAKKHAAEVAKEASK